MDKWAVQGAVGGAWQTDLLVDLAELLQVVLQEDDPLSLGQTAASLVAVVLRALRRKTGNQNVCLVANALANR